MKPHKHTWEDELKEALALLDIDIEAGTEALIAARKRMNKEWQLGEMVTIYPDPPKTIKRARSA